MALLGQGILPRTPLAQIKLLGGTVIHIQPRSLRLAQATLTGTPGARGRIYQTWRSLNENLL